MVPEAPGGRQPTVLGSHDAYEADWLSSWHNSPKDAVVASTPWWKQTSSTIFHWIEDCWVTGSKNTFCKGRGMGIKSKQRGGRCK